MNFRASVLVDGDVLKMDRKAARHTQQSFSAACGSVSLATVRRAEQGHRVVISSLEMMAKVLGSPTEKYLRHEIINEKSEYSISIDGEWVGFYVETDRGATPYVVEEDITFHQSGNRVTGTSVTKVPVEERREQFEDCKVVHNSVMGLHHVDDWQAPFGIGTFILKSSRNDDWLEGFSAWHDPDSDRIETTRFIIVRKSSLSFDKYYKEAKQIIANDIPLYELRKLMESGYSMESSFRMLSTASRA